MKRLIHASDDATLQKFHIVAYDANNKIIGYLFGYNESRGTAVCRLSDDPHDAKQYSNITSAKRAKAYYNNFSELYVYTADSEGPAVKYLPLTQESADKLNERGGYPSYIRPVEGCRLEVEPV